MDDFQITEITQLPQHQHKLQSLTTAEGKKRPSQARKRFEIHIKLRMMHYMIMMYKIVHGNNTTTQTNETTITNDQFFADNVHNVDHFVHQVDHNMQTNESFIATPHNVDHETLHVVIGKECSSAIRDNVTLHMGEDGNVRVEVGPYNGEL